MRQLEVNEIEISSPGEAVYNGRPKLTLDTGVS